MIIVLLLFCDVVVIKYNNWNANVMFISYFEITLAMGVNT